MNADSALQKLGRSAMVFAIAPLRQRWVRALSLKCDKLETTLIWCEAGQFYSILVDGEQKQPETVDFEDILRSIGRQSALLLAAGTGQHWLHSTSLGIAAQQYGAALLVGKDDEYENWVSRKIAFQAPDDPDAAVERMMKVLDDHAAVEETKTRARRLFDYMYRPDVMDMRLSTAISLLHNSGDA